MPDILNPYDHSVVGHVTYASEADVDAALQRAGAYKAAFAALPAREKAAILTRTAALIETHQRELAQLIASESAKPMRYALGEVKRAVETFTFAADEARRLRGETIPMDAASGGTGKFGYYIREPIGVIAAITPFNFPLNLVAHKVAPAVAVGCPILLKPAPATPLTALRLVDLMREAGLDEAAFQVVVGDADVGRWITADDRVSMITFTGSAGVGQKISQVVGLRKATYELGGNAGVILDEGTPLADALINRLLVGSFAYSGQVCISVQRIYAHRSLYEDLRRRLVERANTLVSGNPLDEATEIGPLINDQAVQRIAAWVQEGVENGAALLTGGTYEGRIFAPTIMENVPDHLNLICSEVFGPVVSLMSFDDFESAIEAVNDSEFGLQAGVYTSDLKKMMLATQRLDVGGVIINDVPTFRVDQMPYGGNKKSGTGREGPQFAIEDMTVIKMVVINT